jgi:hypothetical protein
VSLNDPVKATLDRFSLDRFSPSSCLASTEVLDLTGLLRGQGV